LLSYFRNLSPFFGFSIAEKRARIPPLCNTDFRIQRYVGQFTVPAGSGATTESKAYTLIDSSSFYPFPVKPDMGKF
jgi:hypothetical protein